MSTNSLTDHLVLAEGVSMSETREVCVPQETVDFGNGVGTGKLKKFTFTRQFCFLLLQCVRQHNAHGAAYCKKDEIFSAVRGTFIENLQDSICTLSQNTSVKTLRDKFRKMLTERKTKNAQQEGAFGSI